MESGDVHDPEQTSESRLGTDSEGEIEHYGDDAVRWGEGEKAGDGSDGLWHSFECLGERKREQDQEERRVECRYLRRAARLASA